MKPEMQDIHSCWPLKFASEPLKVEEGNAFPACFPKAFMRKIFKELLNSTFNCKFVNLNDMIRKTLVLLMLGCSLSVHAQTNFDNYDSSRGFRHPGGLHTQADFNRIKQQLADGNAAVTASYNILKNAAYAQPNAGTNPVETIVRGGGSGENYMHAARGATIAYQNALRWKIEGNTACADHAVEVLMRWANTTKYISGNSDQRLAYGLYGYQFAQAAELMRDYEGWSRTDFRQFQQWMLDVWYPGIVDFLRGRNGTWANSGRWWEAPGHYWSNWGLCNALACISIGVLCDDVYIYNQGISFIKYDQVGTFPRTADSFYTDGLTEFWGNLMWETHESSLETGAYGVLAQTNESGRDTGHCSMALGLAVDIAHQAWNQGDDLFSYMDHRLAAGIEYVAAQTQSVENLPWREMTYTTAGYSPWDDRQWKMTGPALGAQNRPYWGTVIGHYEGIKGVKMPYAELAYQAMVDAGVDHGGLGGTSGGYDHLGYSILLNTYDGIAPANKVPTELTPKMEYTGSLDKLIPSLTKEQERGNVSGTTIYHSELGGLVNHYRPDNQVTVPKGKTIKLTAVLPAGETNTGKWQWNTGQKTQSITVNTDKSYAYRVTYTNKNGVTSEQLFTIAVEGDCLPSTATQTIKVGDETVGEDAVTVEQGTSVVLTIAPRLGYYGSFKWSTGKEESSVATSSITLDNITKSTVVTVTFTCEGGRQNVYEYNIKVNRHYDFDEDKDYTPVSKTINSALLHKQMNGGWQTICLPFDMSNAQIKEVFGENASLYRLDRVIGTTMNFRMVYRTLANIPYLIYSEKTDEEYEFEDVTVKPGANAADQTETIGAVSFIGTYKKVSPGAAAFSIKDNKVVELTEGESVKPFEGYFYFNAGADEVKALTNALKGLIGETSSDADNATDIQQVDAAGGQEDAVYMLNGQRLAGGQPLGKGVYIVRKNGKTSKVVVR